MFSGGMYVRDLQLYQSDLLHRVLSHRTYFIGLVVVSDLLHRHLHLSAQIADIKGRTERADRPSARQLKGLSHHQEFIIETEPIHLPRIRRAYGN